MRQMRPADVARWLAENGDARPVLLDVREDWEYKVASVAGSVHIPMGQIAARVGELPSGRPVVCMCHHGMRSMQVGMFLERQGFGDVVNLAGGIDGWSREVDASVPTY